MSNIIPFESSKLPAHLKGAASRIDELFAGSGGGFPVMSIKGKVFAIKRGDEKQVITRPDDPDAPASSVELVIVRAQKGLSKTFYLKGYTEGSAEAPDCMSSNGETPDPSSPKPQATKCAICKHNQWGSKVNEQGKELKACQDNKRLAVAAPGQVNDPMLLRVPPGSFKALNEYAKLLKTRGVDFNAVATKVSFVMDAATPQLAFKPVGFLEADQYKAAEEMYHSDIVQQIVGLVPTDEGAAAEFDEPANAQATETEAADEAIDPVPAEVAEEAAQAVTAAKAAAKKPAAKKPEAKPEPEVIDVDLDASLEAALAELDTLSFDD